MKFKDPIYGDDWFTEKDRQQFRERYRNLPRKIGAGFVELGLMMLLGVIVLSLWAGLEAGVSDLYDVTIYVHNLIFLP